MSETDLVLALRALGSRLRSEPTADLAPGVAARLVEPARVGARARWRIAAVVAAALLVVSAAAVAGTPRLRDAVRDWLADAVGVDAQQVDRLPPTVPVNAIPGLGLGRRADVAEAERLLRGPLPRSDSLGQPDLIFAGPVGAGVSVTLLWRASDDLRAAPDLPAVGALLTLAPPRDAGDPWRIGKSLGPGSRAVFVDLATSPRTEGVWIEGAAHAVTMRDGRIETFRLAANVLIWRVGDRVYRLESALDRDSAVEIASTLALNATAR